jgi:hypothetical protein
VGLAAVELDDEALGRPQRVDGVGADGLVDLVRSGQPVGVEEGEEERFELALGDRGSEVAAVHDGPQRRCPSSSVVSCEEGIEGKRACEAAVLGLVDRPLELVGRQDCRQVEEGAGGGGDRDPLLHRDLVGRERDAARVDAGPLTAPRQADLGSGPRRVADAPQRGGGAVTEHRAGAGSEHRRHPRPMARQHRMPDRKDAAMDRMQTPDRKPVVDRSAS